MALRQILLLLALCIALALSSLLAPAPSQAIGKATPTPDATPIPEDLDVETALEAVLKHIEERDYDAAIALADRILETDAESWEAYFYRAFTQVRNDDLDAALADYDAALDLRPWDASTWRLRGDTHLRNQNPRGARSDYIQALFYNPRSLQTYLSLVGLHERDVDKTIRDLYQALIDGVQASAQGNKNRAIDTLSDLIDAFDRRNLPADLAFAYFSRANIRRSDEDWARALSDLTMAIALQPEMQDFYLARGFVYSETDELRLAGRDYFQRLTLLERESFAATLERDDNVSVEMEFGLVARLSFEATAGQLVTIAARDNLGAGVDPLLVLLDPAGSPIAGNDDGGGELDSLIRNFAVPSTGVYTALVSHANSGYEGMIRVSLR